MFTLCHPCGFPLVWIQEVICDVAFRSKTPNPPKLAPLVTILTYCRDTWGKLQDESLVSGHGYGIWYTECQPSKTMATYSSEFCSVGHEIVVIYERNLWMGLSLALDPRSWKATCCTLWLLFLSKLNRVHLLIDFRGIRYLRILLHFESMDRCNRKSAIHD